MCFDCVLASPRIAQVDPGDEPLSEVVLSQYHPTSILKYLVVATTLQASYSSPDLPAGITLRNIVSCLALHSCPPKLLPQVMIHLGAPRMNGVPQCLGFIQNLLQSLFLGHYQSLFEP
jgi:hypothetical protein